MNKALLRTGLTREQVEKMTTRYRSNSIKTATTDASGIGVNIRDLELGAQFLFPIARNQSTRKYAAIAYQRAKERGIKIKTSVRPEGLQIERVK